MARPEENNVFLGYSIVDIFLTASISMLGEQAT
jgi:hypothetical protein